MTVPEPNQPPSFEQAISELETLVEQMESNQLPLDQSLLAYKRGSELLQFCQQTLQDMEQQVQILSENNQLKPFSDIQ